MMRFHYDQEDVEAICTQSAELTEEYCKINYFHGAASIFRDYAGLAANEPLYFGVEHFIPFLEEKPHEAIIRAGLPKFLATTPQRAALYHALGVSSTHVSGFKSHYARRLFEREHGKFRMARQGTIAFPHKSTRTLERDYDREGYAAWLAALPQSYQPVVVCVFWKDVHLGAHRVFQKHGLKVVSCGHHLDGKFLLRFHDLCRHFRYSASNTIATSSALSMAEGCEFFFHETGPLTERNKDGEVTHDIDPFLTFPVAVKTRALAPFPPGGSSIRWRQRLLAWKLTGALWVRSPRRIRLWQARAKEMLLSAQTSCWQASFDGFAHGLYNWLPKQIDKSGWCGHEGGLTVRATGQAGGFEVIFELPPQSDCETLEFTVETTAGAQMSKQLKPGCHRLTVPLGAAGEDMAIRWRLEVPLLHARQAGARAIWDDRIKTLWVAWFGLTSDDTFKLRSCDPAEIERLQQIKLSGKKQNGKGEVQPA